MIGYLSGRIASIKPTRLLLDVNGVGYDVHISLSTFEVLSGSDKASLFIYTSVKEDSITLFGFSNETEKEMFELLISVNGIGPKLALNMLSGIRVDELRESIETNNVSRIVAVPGIGRKTAERVVLELRSKVDTLSEGGSQGGSFNLKQEAVAALTTLGYNYKNAEAAVREVINGEPGISLEDLIKKALAVFNKQ